MVQAITVEAARLLVEGLQERNLPLSKGKSKVLIDGPDKLKQGLLLEALGIDEIDSACNVGADLLLGRRRRAHVVEGRLARAAGRSRRVRQLLRAGAHTRKLTLTGSNAGVLWGSEVLGFAPSQLKGTRTDAAKANFRLSRGQNAATTMLAHAQPAGAKNTDPAFRHHRQVVLTGVWEGAPELGTMQAALRGAVARLSRLRRPWCGATDSAATFVLTLLRLGWSAESARRLTTHVGTTIDLLAVAPKTTLLWSDSSAHWNHSEGPLFWGKPSGRCSSLASWRAGHFGIGTCWSSWSREASGRKSGSRGSGETTRTAASSVTRTLAPCSTDATNHRRCARRHILLSRNTGNSLHRAFSLAQARFCPQVLLSRHAQFCGTTRPQMGSWRGTSSRTGLRRAVARCGAQAGQWWRSTSWRTSRARPTGRCRATCCQGKPRAMARTTRRPWQGLSPWTLSRCTSTAKGTIATVNGPRHKALGTGGPPRTCLEQASGFPRRGQGSQGQGPRHTA